MESGNATPQTSMLLADEPSPDEAPAPNPQIDASRTVDQLTSSSAPRYDAVQERGDQDDLRELQRSGTSIVLPPTAPQATYPVVVDPLPLANTQWDVHGDRNSPTQIRSNYAAGWINR